ncbi:transporter [Diaminobutyricibacter sp. McL0608]|uniref:SLAC1 family transporter n=1 Tax=Leifsonia sp. McL0608 TaxID=3143537 RepID=UPI0031F2D632
MNAVPDSRPGAHPAAHSPGRIPLNTLAIAFGLAGLSTSWTLAVRLLGVPVAIPDVLWIITAIAWAWLIVAHLVRGSRTAESLITQLKHPAQGPIAALVPVVGMLLGANLFVYWPIGGQILVALSIVVAALFAGWILAFWMSGQLKPEVIHGGYFLPTVAAGLVASATAAKVGFPLVATGAFAVGILFWIVILTLLVTRMAFLPPLPDPLVPTLAIILAPPPVAGIAWFAMRGEHPDAVATALLGLTVLFFAMQVALLPRYMKLTFSLGFWSFTFPFAAMCTFGMQWSALGGLAGWQVVAGSLLAAATVLIGTIGIASLILVAKGRRGARRAQRTLSTADDALASG